jgi:RimJ/RimL family protein N-acetyltransferase
MAGPTPIVAGERVILSAPERDHFVGRWELFNDPLLCMWLGSPALANGPQTRTMPPITREHREALYQDHVARRLLCFDVRLRDSDARCVGEAYLRDLTWPRASGELAVAILAPEDRGEGFGLEAATLLCAYAFDGLGLNRVWSRFPTDNAAAAAAANRLGQGMGWRQVGVERESEWVLGRHGDAALWELLRSDFPPHPATAELRTPPGQP